MQAYPTAPADPTAHTNHHVENRGNTNNLKQLPSFTDAREVFTPSF